TSLLYCTAYTSSPDKGKLGGSLFLLSSFSHAMPCLSSTLLSAGEVTVLEFVGIRGCASIEKMALCHRLRKPTMRYILFSMERRICFSIHLRVGLSAHIASNHSLEFFSMHELDLSTSNVSSADPLFLNIDLRIETYPGKEARIVCRFS